jgi:quercetin dioxygenase-like cupin family protein
MKTKTHKKRIAIAISIGVALLAITVYAATPNNLVEGTIPNSKLFDGPAKVTVRTLTINPQETLLWHYHPGYAFNVVKSGTLTVEDGCGGEETLTGTGNVSGNPAFEEMDGRVHRAKNLGTEPVVVYNTFIMPQGKPTTVNIPGNERRCGPPENVDECKNDGWLNFTHPQSFIDQGQCIDFLRHRPRNTIPVPEDPLNP